MKLCRGPTEREAYPGNSAHANLKWCREAEPKDKSATAAVWRQQLEAEFCKATGRRYAAALLDLQKADELVRHRTIKDKAGPTGFHLALARLAVSLYAGPRAVEVEGACSGTVSLTTYIVAGCGLASAMLRVFLLDIHCLNVNVDIKLCVYVGRQARNKRR